MSMNKIIILYKSKYGATKKYADMLKDELSCESYDIADHKKIPFEQYDCVIYAGALYAGKIAGFPILRKLYPKIRSKKVLILCVGASPFDQKAIEEVKLHNLTGDLKDLPLFYARGAWDESRMTLKDRTMCKMLKKMLAGRGDSALEPWMRELLCGQGTVCDWTDRENLAPILSCVKE